MMLKTSADQLGTGRAKLYDPVNLCLFLHLRTKGTFTLTPTLEVIVLSLVWPFWSYLVMSEYTPIRLEGPVIWISRSYGV